MKLRKCRVIEDYNSPYTEPLMINKGYNYVKLQNSNLSSHNKITGKLT